VEYKRGGGSYIGGSTVIRDPSWRGRVAHRMRMTEKHKEKERQAKEKFAAEMESYKRRIERGEDS
jgi:hypothetical protein